MTTYNTGNGIGSADPRDLYDNAQVIDDYANGDADTTQDRLGVTRKTLAGMENEFDQDQSDRASEYAADKTARDTTFDADQADRAQRWNLLLANSGYDYLADYTAGIEITEYNQVIRDSAGELWRASASTALPYTTDGTGLPEGGAFVAIGDADIRNDLAAGVAGGKGALLVRGSVIYVDTIADLQALPTSELVDGRVVETADTNPGAFVWSDNDLSVEVADDINGDFFVAPISDATGSTGAWVRRYGIVLSDEFSQYAPNGAELLSSIDGYLYIRTGDAWVKADQPTIDIVNNHVQTRDAHGLRDSNVELGQGASATGIRSIAVGYGAKSESSIVIGRESSSTESPFSLIVSPLSHVENTTGDITNYRHNTLLNCHRSSIINSDRCVGINSPGLINGLIRESSECLSVLSPESASPAIDYASNSYAIGGQIQGSAVSPIEDCIAIGHLSTANYNDSVAIGAGVQTTADSEIRIGKSSNSTVVPGNFSVSGTKNFVIPHPEPSKADTHLLYHGSYEGPVPGGTIYRYTVTTVNNEGVVNLPDYFKHLNKDQQVWCSPKKHFGQAYGEIEGNTLTVTSNSDGMYEVLILATRDDAGVKNWKGSEVEHGNS